MFTTNTKSSRYRENEKSFWHLWWLNPVVVLCAMLLATGYSAYLIPGDSYQFNWNTSKFFDTQALLYVVYASIAFAGGGVLVSTALPRVKHAASGAITEHLHLPWRALRILFYATFTIILLAYAVWLAVLARHGVSLSALSAGLQGDAGASYELRGDDETLPGVTTLTQLAPGFFILGVILISRFGWKSSLLTVILPMLVIFFVTCVRSKLWSERLAVLEVVIPCLILSMRLVSSEKWKWWARGSAAIAPLIAPIVLFAFFSAAEYSRSWVGYYSETSQDSFLFFSFTRLVGYYATALNNGALAVQVLHHYDVPYYSLLWLWRFPALKTLLPYETFAHATPREDYNDLLARMGNSEFSNPSGIFLVRLDYGFTGGLVAWFAFGVIAMLLYRSFVSGSLPGILLFPFLYIGLLESPRILYWFEPRALPTWGLLFFILALALVMSQTVRPARRIRDGIVRKAQSSFAPALPQRNRI